MGKVIPFRRREGTVSLSVLDNSELIRFDSIKPKSPPETEMLCWIWQREFR